MTDQERPSFEQIWGPGLTGLRRRVLAAMAGGAMLRSEADQLLARFEQAVREQVGLSLADGFDLSTIEPPAEAVEAVARSRHERNSDGSVRWDAIDPRLRAGCLGAADVDLRAALPSIVAAVQAEQWTRDAT